MKKKTIQYKFQASSTLIDMETSWTTFKKNINFSEYEENMKEEKNQEILDEKNPSTTKTKIKKKKDFLYLVTVPSRRLPWCLRDKNFAHLHEKRMIFFCFKCFTLPHIKNSNDSSNADDFMFKKKKIFFLSF